jgi:hypothetical protein
MRGGLRWPSLPFRVICVLVAVLLTAAFSLRVNVVDRVRATPMTYRASSGDSRLLPRYCDADAVPGKYGTAKTRPQAGANVEI